MATINSTMRKSLTAVFENGVLRPLEPLDLPEHQQVAITVSETQVSDLDDELLDANCLQDCASEADESISLEVVREALSKIPGTMTADFSAKRDE